MRISFSYANIYAAQSDAMTEFFKSPSFCLYCVIPLPFWAIKCVIWIFKGIFLKTVVHLL